MNELKQIKAIPKYGNEDLTYNGQKIDYNLLDFWRWSTSDLMSNATRIYCWNINWVKSGKYPR